MRVRRALAALLGALLVMMISCSCDGIFGGNPAAATPDSANRMLSVHYLDVGQGDAIFIELPNGESILMDTGENYHGEGLINYIRRCGHEQLDYLIGSHPHSDHIGSMPYIVRRFPVREVYLPDVAADTHLYEELISCIKRKELTVHRGAAGVVLLEDGDLKASMLGPVTIDDENLNNSSIILKIEYGGTSFLFLADAETEELSSVTLDMSADVLKVGHHGSRSSTTQELLDRVNPRIAVISVGEDNEYGHPHQETMALLEAMHCEVYRTDRDGTVTITSDGETLHVRTGGDSIERAK